MRQLGMWFQKLFGLGCDNGNHDWHDPHLDMPNYQPGLYTKQTCKRPGCDATRVTSFGDFW